MRSALLFVMLQSVSALTPGEQFVEFEQVFDRRYSSTHERLQRLAAFVENLAALESYRVAEQGTAVYSHLTPFADLTPKEFSARHGFRVGPRVLAGPPDAEWNATVPADFDWRAKGAVNSVKNQLQCGSCWAFATVANVEGAGFVATQKLVSLSEQELVDCDTQDDQGCNGGLPRNAYEFMISTKTGLETEVDYPYTAEDGMCVSRPKKQLVFVGGWKQISSDEVQIAAALMHHGPLAIGINAGPMQMYWGGIAHPTTDDCDPEGLDHGVAIVAFGVERHMKYWTIRNSWGPDWGEEGYYRIIRGVGACGLNRMVTTATAVSVSSSDNAVVV